MRVSNLTSPSSGREVANQFEIEHDDGRYFQSYRSVIAYIPANREEAFYRICGGSLHDHNLEAYPEVYLDRRTWDYSVTTGKYRNQWLGENKRETEKRIKSGEYKLVDLN